MKFRHEWKHEITFADMLTIRQRMQAVAKPDSHAEKGKYLVKSLYFDNWQDKVLREKADGVNQREKFRIRYYNEDFSLIHLEKKSKQNGLGNKQSVRLSAEETEKIIKGDCEWMGQSEKGLILELYGKMQLQGLRPKTIVSYIREPFVYSPGNVRVTIDYDIRTGIQCTEFLNPDCLNVQAGDSPIILEVKWDEFLPSVIRDAVQLSGRRTASFSKYALCRIYG